MIAGRPSISAQGMAMHRAAHQLYDRPLVLEDRLALGMVGAEGRAVLQADPDAFRRQHAIRAFTVARSRFAEDALRRAPVTQYVVLAAGLDTSGYRISAAPSGFRIFEVDRPATQAWKRARLGEAGIAVPDMLRFVAIDFEKQTLAEGLHTAGFHIDQPTFFSFLGAVMFLESATALKIFRLIGALPSGSGIVFDYGVEASALDAQQRAERAQVLSGLASIGEPVKTFFDTYALAQSLKASGLGVVEDVGYAEMNARYFSNRTDDLRVGRNGRRLVHAQVLR